MRAPTASGVETVRQAEPPPLDKRPQATSYRVEDLLELVRQGRIRVPSFQREWQWQSEHIADLFDSLFRGYPVGTLLLWKRKGDAATLKLGPHTFTVPAREDALWVIDGQQRITALAGVLIAQEAEPSPKFDLYFDLENPGFKRPARGRPPAKDWIPMSVVVDAEDLFAWLDEYRQSDPPKERVQLAIRLGKLIREYEIPAYVVDTDDERVLRHVFHRVNTAGKPLLEGDVFDALHGARGQAHPGELREVAERLRDARFGVFDKNLLLRTLQSLLGLDVATDYKQRLPEGTNPGEVLARTEQAVRRVIAFLREDAGIPHIRLLPYEMTVVTLALFFDRHPEPSARTKRLLARWIWRGAVTGAHRGDTVTLRSTLSAIWNQKETEAVNGLLLALPEQSSATSRSRRFNFRHARSKLEVLALLALEPKSMLTGHPVTIEEMFDDDDRREIVPMIIEPRSTDDSGKDLLRTIANRIVHPPLSARRLRELLDGDVPDGVLKSHMIARSAWSTLRRGDRIAFLEARGRKLAQHIAAFLDARAEWRHNDRPALKALVVPDD